MKKYFKCSKVSMIVFLCTVLVACAAHPSNAIDSLAEDVIKKHEGIDIRLVPLDPENKN